MYVKDENGVIARDENGAVVEGTKTKQIIYEIPGYIDFVKEFSEYYKGDSVNPSLDVSTVNVELEKSTPVWLAFLPYIIVILS